MRWEDPLSKRCEADIENRFGEGFSTQLKDFWVDPVRPRRFGRVRSWSRDRISSRVIVAVGQVTDVRDGRDF